MSAYTYTLTNLLLATRTILQESTADFWTDSILTSYINEAIRTIAERTGCYRTIQSVSTVATTRLVAFTGYKCIAIEYNNKALIKITPLQVGHTKIDGVTPQYWFEHGSYVGIEPIPPAIYTLSLYVAAIPPNIAGASDVPVIPYSFCSLIPYYAAARAFEQDKRSSPTLGLMSIFFNELEYMSQALLPNVPS